MSSESTNSRLQYDPYLISVACSYTELSISKENLGDKGRVCYPKKLKILTEVP